MIQSIEDGRKEDGNRSIADKIIKRLHDLDMSVENNQGRWAWELLQNAKDSIADYDNRRVSIQIELNENEVEFRHNGVHFTEQDVRGLINQISSKEIEEGQQTKQIGRFGTGFLTTHLLSKIILVKGTLETVNKEFYEFAFTLNREGKTTTQLIPKIEMAWKEFHNSTTLIKKPYIINDYSTSFCYKLDTDEQRQIAKIGVSEFIKLIPYVLAFIPKIGKVEIFDKASNTQICFENNLAVTEKYIKTISKSINFNKNEVHILLAEDEKVSIAIEVEMIPEGFKIKNIKDIPKIFCDFPLIGTENFHFPLVVNSFFFNPQTERDGVWLKGNGAEIQENKKIFESAIDLYKGLLTEISEKHFFDLFNLVETKIPKINENNFDDNWYKVSIQKPLRQHILSTNLVEIDNETNQKKLISDLWFPSKIYSEQIQEKLWQFTSDLYLNSVCKKSHLNSWCDVSWDEWNKITYAEIVKDLTKQGNIETLSKALSKDELNTFDWLNSACKFLLEEDSNLAHFENFSITPNQNGVFKKRAELCIDKIKDDDLINILELLGDDWKDILLHDSVEFGKYTVKNINDIASKITDRLQKSTNKNDNFIEAISLLSEWFEVNKGIAKEVFLELYKKRAELFMNTISDKESLYKVMRSKTNLAQLSKVAQALESNPKLLESVQKAEELNNLLIEFDSTDVTELKRKLRQIHNKTDEIIKTEITQDVLISLGVTTIEELEDALKDKEISSRFYHDSTPNFNMFLYVQGLINRAKQNIIAHLKNLPDYDCTELEELATTVLGGVRKDGDRKSVV